MTDVTVNVVDRGGTVHVVSSTGAVNVIETVREAVKIALPGPPSTRAALPGYSTRAAFVVAVAAGLVVSTGEVIVADGLAYKRVSGATAIGDLPGFVPSGEVYPDHFAENTTPGTTDMASALQAAITYCATGGISSLHGFRHVYRINSAITVPKICGVTILGEGVHKSTDEASDPLRAATEIRAGAAMTALFVWSGDATVTAYDGLAKSFGVRNCIINGNSNTTYLFDVLNADDFQLHENRLIGSASIVRSLFNGTYTGSNLPGGHRIFDNNFGAKSGTNIEIDAHTQDWIRGNWFASTGSSKDIVISRSDKINIVDNEFNRSTGTILELSDGPGFERCGSIVVVANKINANAATVIDDNRTNSGSRRLIFAANSITDGVAIDEQGLHNPASNLISYARDGASLSFASAVRGGGALFIDESPVIEVRNTDTTAGTGGIIRLGHSQDGSTTPLMEWRAELSNGLAASRASQASLWVATGGALAHVMQVDEAGRVGFGTTNPDTAGPLTAETNGATPATFRRTSAGNVANKITDGSNTIYFGMDSSGNFAIDGDANLAATPWFKINASTKKLTGLGGIEVTPASSETPSTNGSVVLQLTSNTELHIRVKGSDGVIRQVALTLA